MASLFWPMLIEVRGLLERLELGDLSQAASFIKASLCDGEDEAAPELREALEVTITEEQRRAWLVIRARVGDIVHSLLRVEKFQTSLPKIINPKPNKMLSGKSTLYGIPKLRKRRQNHNKIPSNCSIFCAFYVQCW